MATGDKNEKHARPTIPSTIAVVACGWADGGAPTDTQVLIGWVRDGRIGSRWRHGRRVARKVRVVGWRAAPRAGHSAESI